MELARSRFPVLLNALYATGTTTIGVAHPSHEIGELVSVDLGAHDATTVRFPTRLDDYAAARTKIANEDGTAVADELPEPRSYANTLLAGGLLEPANADEIAGFCARNGRPDLTAGHRPVVAGFDTNLLPWRIADVLDLVPGEDATVNGFALATGVRDELDWDRKVDDTRPLERAFGDDFEALWNQPSGARREGRLGETYYRRLRDHRYAEEVVTDRGDEAIVEGYEAYQDDSRKDVLLFSNDRDFVERARSHRVLAQRVEFPDALPRSTEAPWADICDALYVLVVCFGVLRLPKVTLYGVWRGKEGQAWQDEQVRIECRSPKVEPLLERDLEVLRTAD